MAHCDENVKVNLCEMSLKEMEDFFQFLGEPKYRGRQVFGWIYGGTLKKGNFRPGICSFDEMDNIPQALKKKLKEKATLGILKPIKIQQSMTDGTRKYLFELYDGNAIESVFMKYKFGNSICVSSQAGCRMGCKFCASGIGGLKRNLNAWEIAGQITAAERDTGEKISHVVVMGTGEPFDNYQNVSNFIRIINDKNGMNIGMRNITVSTCGIIPMIEKFGDDFPQANLAISLHATNEKMRSAIMPINNAFPMSQLLETCQRYSDKTSRRVTFEYTLVKGVNDGIEDAEDLASRLKGMLCHVNLIPLNVVNETGLNTTDHNSALKFLRVLEQRGIPSTIRRELGDDIDAACGQLRLNTNRAIAK